MTDNMERQDTTPMLNNKLEQCKLAVVDYLQSIELLPLSEAEQQWIEGNYHHIRFMKTFINDEDKKHHRLMISTSERNNFLSKIGEIFHEKVNSDTLYDTVGNMFESLNEWPLLLSTVLEY